MADNQRYNIYTGNDGYHIKVPIEIPMRDSAGNFTEEFRNYVTDQREIGNVISNEAISITDRTRENIAARAEATVDSYDANLQSLWDKPVWPERLPEPETEPEPDLSPADIYASGLLPELDLESEEENRETARLQVIRSITETGVTMGETLVDIASAIDPTDSWFGKTPEEREQRRREAARRTADWSSKIFSWVTEMDTEDLFDPETGEVRAGEGLAGIGTDLAMMINAYSHLSKMKIFNKIPNSIGREVTKAAILENFMINPEEGNFATMLEDIFIDPEGRSLNWAQSAIEFLSTDPDDPRHIARLKMQVDAVALGILFELGGEMAIRTMARRKHNVKAEDLTEEQKVDILVDQLEEARELAQLGRQRGSEQLNLLDSDEEIESIIRQTRSWQTGEGLPQKIQYSIEGSLRSLGSIFFQSDGYLTRSAKNVLDDSVYAQRAAMQYATDIAGRLETKLNNLMSNSSFDEFLPQQIQEILTSDFNLPRVINEENLEEVTQNLIDQFSIPREIVPEVLEARTLIDDYSRNMLHSDFVPDNVKEIINENIGAYIKRSYHAYEDVNYTPSIDVRIRAEEFIKNNIINNSTEMDEIESLIRRDFGDDIPDDEFFSRRNDIINTRVTDTVNDLLDTDIFEYTDKSRTLNKYIFKGRQDIPEEIRDLLGEIQEPSLNIIKTVEKMSKFYEVARFHGNLDNLGNGKYIFDEGIARDTSIFTEQINFPNSPLHGKWTTPQIADTLKNNNIWNPMGIVDSEFFKNLAMAKGTSQMSKTVLSVATQARNAWGGTQFALANGVWPFKDGINNNAMLWNKILDGGDEALQENYRLMQRLGVINTNVRVNEFRALLEHGADTTADNLLDNLRNIPYGGQALNKTIDGATEVYMATDDFFKMNNYMRELDTLKEAYPNEALDVLQQEAARKVKNTFPNYDRVPSGIRTLRFLPFGNFVSFPAEMWRTSYNIVTEASREITSGNPTLRQRGLQRLSGFMLSMGSWQGAATMSAMTYGLSPEEERAIHEVTRNQWNDGATRNIVRVGDKFYTQDTTNFNSYNTIRAPLMEAYDNIRTGQLHGDELDEVLLDVGLNFANDILEPFIGTAMLAEAGLDFRSALGNRGLGIEGDTIFKMGEGFTGTVGSLLEVAIAPFMPGTIDDAIDLYNIAAGNVNEYSGKLPEWQGELVASLIGIRFQEVDPAQALRWAWEDYEEATSNLVNENYPTFRDNADDVIAKMDANLLSQYRALQDLYTTYNAVGLLLDADNEYGRIREQQRETEDLAPYDLKAVTPYSILQEIPTVTDNILRSLESGQFFIRANPVVPIRNSFERGTPFSDEILEEEAKDKLDLLQETAIKYIMAPLHFGPDDISSSQRHNWFPSVGGREQFVRDIERGTLQNRREREVELERAARGDFAKGGEVYNVPQVPREPDERIDKMTGLPYNEQAGEAYIDEEDRN